MMRRKSQEPEQSDDLHESSVDDFLNQAAKFPLLTADEEKLLGRLKMSGDQRARDRLIESNFRLVVSRAVQIRQSRLSFADLIQEGNIGLVRAVDAFDPCQNKRFSTLAVPCIDRAMVNAVQRTDRIITIPHWLQTLYNKACKISYEYYERNGCRCDLTTLHQLMLEKAVKANRKPVELHQLKNAILAMGVVAIIDADINSDSEEDANFIDYFANAAEPSLNLDQEVIDLELREVILQGIDTVCSGSMKTILIKHFGLENEPPLTLEEVGSLFKVTRERIRQIEKNALALLRQDHFIFDYLHDLNQLC